MKKLTFLLAAILVLGVSNFVSAQDDSNEASHRVKVQIPQYALVGLSSTDEITLSPKAPTTAGMDLEFEGGNVSNNSKWLHYSYLASEIGDPISISVKMENIDGGLPQGIGIGLKVAEYDGDGKGKTGKVANDEGIDLASSSTTIIHDIKNCYTGTGAQGHRLTYTLKKTGNIDYSELAAGISYSVNIVYTITD